jgi:1-aminocyclopropane-1-carboxylate deaminase/D-cysteine desulfhydrase-like pyridoxal-dependent ACC family enzyme
VQLYEGGLGSANGLLLALSRVVQKVPVIAASVSAKASQNKSEVLDQIEHLIPN